MREILFRGKRVDTGEWVYGSFVPDLLEVFNGFEELDGFIKPFEKTPDKRRMVEVERSTVGQYTGLTDRNGVKIFEGGILHFINTYRNVNHEWHCTVEFVDGAFVCRYIESEGHLGEYNYFTSWNVPLVQWDVIGNIHDNPELLQEISR